MKFSHCDHDEQFLTLHDCIADRAYIEDGKLVFEFDDGFWISPKHPESDLDLCVRTDFAKAEYILDRGETYDAYAYVFKRNFFKKIVRYFWTLQELLDKIQNKECKVEFKYQYLDERSRIIECQLIFAKKLYWVECMIYILGPKEGPFVNYLWNNLCEDRPW